MKGIVFGLKSLALMIFASFIAWCVTYLGLNYIWDLDLVWEWRAIIILSVIMGWATSWIPFFVLTWFEEKE